MKKLQELKFIDIKAGKSGPMGNAIIWNPHLILRWHYSIKTPGLTQASYAALLETALDVGAGDMQVEWTPYPPDGAPPAPAIPLTHTASTPEADKGDATTKKVRIKARTRTRAGATLPTAGAA